jgi:ABC-type multidrug transport system fused ATPase/permease subunit
MEANSLIKKGKSSVLQADDMLLLPDNLKAKNSARDFSKLNFKSPNRLLFSTIFYTKNEIFPAYFWYFLSTLMSLLSPLLIHHFIQSISNSVNPENFWNVIYTGIFLGLFGMFSGQFVQQFFVRALGSYQILTNIFNELIFKHSLKLSLEAKSKNQIGDIVNYMGTDSESVADFTFIFGDMSMNLLLAIGSISMLFYYLGLSAISALIVMIAMIPITKKIATKFIHLEDEMMNLRDKRVTMMSQILNAIRIIKFYAWENSIEAEVQAVRNVELETRKRLARSQVLSGVTYTATSTIVLFVALLTHSLRGFELDAALIFTCVSLFGILEGPIGELSHILSRLTNSVVGAKRILKYLSEETKINNLLPSEIKAETVSVKINNLSSYYENENNLVIKDLSFELNAGESLAIIGPVGAGKSSLLYALLNEMKSSKGEVQFWDRDKLVIPLIAYLPQEAYIINDSLKNNVLFGESYNEKSFKNALYCAVLDRDIQNFSSGLETEIGEKGVNLSGGQKQRVGLARAVLANPNLILLDDPLSAVDSNTENELMNKLIFGQWKNKTKIIVTHRLAHLDRFDKILFLNHGKMEAFGSLNELLISSPLFVDFYKNHEKESLSTDSSSHIETMSVGIKSEEKAQRITEDEDREIGAVKKTIYFDYIKSLGGDDDFWRPYILVCLFLGAGIVAFSPLLQKYWLSYFTSHSSAWSGINGILIYGFLGLLVIIFGMFNSFFWLNRGIMASRILHDKMLSSVLNAPIRFFDSTPVGRILQRFSRDVESVDIYLQWSFVSVVNCILQVGVSLFLILGLMPHLIIFILPLLLVYYRFQKDYRSSAREAKRFDSISRSPRYAHFKETLQGILVIRSYKKEHWFIDEFFNRLENSQRMFYSHYMLNRWFSSRIPIVGGMISIVSTIGITIFARYGMMNAGTAGLVTVYSLSFWGYLNWGIRVFSDIESRMTSVERLKFFASLPPEENKDLIDSTLDNQEFLTSGSISVKNIKVRYADHLPLVLKGISFEIKAGTKVGIIGRTGSGKSTFFQALFRFVPIESGSISIDGVDITNISLKKLRKSMSIIPQDPTLFMGSIRSNLDRYNEYSDAEIYSALEKTGLSSFIQSIPNGLNYAINETGSNLSLGQRQLLCLARALLQKVKIIVMDEATASVDVQTDVLIQKVIRESLENVTMIIIAHRLGTIKDCDQIIEIQDGCIV